MISDSGLTGTALFRISGIQLIKSRSSSVAINPEGNFADYAESGHFPVLYMDFNILDKNGIDVVNCFGCFGNPVPDCIIYTLFGRSDYFDYFYNSHKE